MCARRRRGFKSGAARAGVVRRGAVPQRGTGLWALSRGRRADGLIRAVMQPQAATCALRLQLRHREGGGGCEAAVALRQWPSISFMAPAGPGAVRQAAAHAPGTAKADTPPPQGEPAPPPRDLPIPPGKVRSRPRLDGTVGFKPPPHAKPRLEHSYCQPQSLADAGIYCGRRRNLPVSEPPQEGSLKPRSRWWLVYSALLGGGILYYFALRYDDERRAKQCLWIGIISLAVYPGLMLAVGVASLLDPPPALP